MPSAETTRAHRAPVVVLRAGDAEGADDDGASADQGASLVNALAAAGQEPIAIAAVCRMPLTVGSDVFEALRAAQHTQRPLVVLVTSAWVAERVRSLAVVKDIIDAAIVGALSPTTSAVLRRHGVLPAFDSTDGVAGLTQVCADRLAAHSGRALVLHPTSRQGLQSDSMSPQLRTVADVLRTAVYSTDPDPALEQHLRATGASAAHYVVTSPSVVRALAAVWHPSPLRVLCRGRSTLAQWQALGLGGAAVLLEPSLPLADAVRSALQSQDELRYKE